MTTSSRRKPGTLCGGSLRAPALGLAVLSALTMATLSVRAHAGPWGVPLGNRNVKAEIDSPADVDSYLVEAHAGARLDVKLSTTKSSGLAADVALLGPDGTPLDAAFDASGRSLRLRRYTVPASGRYEIRVTARDDTRGAYSIAAAVKSSAAVSLEGLRLSAGEEQAFDFAAGPGARVTFTVRSKPSAVRFVRIQSPAGVSVAIPTERIRTNAAGRVAGKGIELPANGGFGAWRLVVRADAGALDGVRAKIVAKGGRLPQAKGRLPAREPLLSGVAPAEVGEGTALQISGAGLLDSKRAAVRVFVGGIEAGGVILESDSSVRAVMPGGLTGQLDVAVLNGDGHAAVLYDAVVAVPPPRATAFAPVVGPANGGTVLTIRGSGFRDVSAVTIAGTAFPGQTELVDETTLRFTTPPFAGGAQTIGVRDPTGQTSIAPGTFEFVAAPFVLAVRPALVPRLSGERTTVTGGSFAGDQTVTVGGTPAPSVTVVSAHELRVSLPLLPLGVHDLAIADPLGQVSLTADALSVFTFTAGIARNGTGGPPPADMALCDFDDDGDLDVFLVSRGGATLSSASQLRVLRNDGDTTYVDVTGSVMPTPNGDDWRGDTIAFGDVAGDVGTVPPDGYPDLVIGSLDESVLAASRSRIRVLANRAAPGGGRVFVDRTSVIMSPTSSYDNWKAADIWIGDLDGNGGIDDIVATHDAIEEGVSPLAPYYVYYLSGTRVFSFATPQSGSYGAFAWQSRRMPSIIGTQVFTPGLPLCVGGACRDGFMPFKGTSLAVADLDGDGRRDLAVTSPGIVTLLGGTVSSTQLASNENVLGLDTMVDRSIRLAQLGTTLRGDIVLAGDVAGDDAEDLVVIRHPATGTGLAIDIVENRGFGTSWPLRTTDLLPAADGDERLQADAAELADVDGDGDLDLVLLVVSAPTSGSTATGFGLRLLRNGGEQGFSRALEDLLPDSVTEDWNGTVLSAGTSPSGRFEIVVARPDAQGDGADVRTIVRTIED